MLEWGADEDVAIAALLHDAVEDQGGAALLPEIRNRFGETVAAMVQECSDSLAGEEPKAPWLDRKQAYIASIADKSAGAALITAADKLHNARSIVADLERDGPITLRRFAVPTHVVWYYREVLRALTRRCAPPPLTEISRVVDRLAFLSGQDEQSSVGVVQ